MKPTENIHCFNIHRNIEIPVFQLGAHWLKQNIVGLGFALTDTTNLIVLNMCRMLIHEIDDIATWQWLCKHNRCILFTWLWCKGMDPLYVCYVKHKQLYQLQIAKKHNLWRPYLQCRQSSPNLLKYKSILDSKNTKH